MRKTKEITLEDGKNSLTFKLRQMPATQLETWCYRAGILLAASGKELPDGIGLDGLGEFIRENGLKVLGQTLGSIEFEKARPLLDEMLACCYRLEGKAEIKCSPEIMDDMITDFRTMFRLRMEAIKFNLNFTGPESESPSGSPEKLNIGKPGSKT